eukprot:1898729-Prymnesium_polylepis.1
MCIRDSHRADREQLAHALFGSRIEITAEYYGSQECWMHSHEPLAAPKHERSLKQPNVRRTRVAKL